MVEVSGSAEMIAASRPAFSRARAAVSECPRRTDKESPAVLYLARDDLSYDVR